VFLDGRLDWVEYGSERNGVGVRDGDLGVWMLSHEKHVAELTTGCPSSSRRGFFPGQAAGHVR
jgi:hypothetical protein